MRPRPPWGQGWRKGGRMIVRVRGQGPDWHVTLFFREPVCTCEFFKNNYHFLSPFSDTYRSASLIVEVQRILVHVIKTVSKWRKTQRGMCT
jgi:hypothetical protein